MNHFQFKRVALVLFVVGIWLHWPADVWPQSMDAIIDGAKQEGELMIYGSTDLRQANIIANKFREKYPFIDVKLTRLNSNKLYPKVLSEHRAGKYLVDVLQNNTVGLYFLKKEGLLENYLAPDQSLYPEKFKDPGYWTITNMNVHVLAYNTDKVQRNELPKSYQDLLDPVWKGRLLLNPREHWFAWMLQVMGKEQGLNYMQKLAGQKPVIRDVSTSMRLQFVGAGEAAMDIDSSFSTVKPLMEKGAPLNWFTLDPVFVVPSGHGLAAHAPHPNAAKLFIDYILSKDGQRAVLALDRYSIRSDLMQEQTAIKDMNLVPPDPAMGEDMRFLAKKAEEIFVK
jgi:iron(III) transport system substrate-binding protein